MAKDKDREYFNPDIPDTFTQPSPSEVEKRRQELVKELHHLLENYEGKDLDERIDTLVSAVANDIGIHLHLQEIIEEQRGEKDHLNNLNEASRSQLRTIEQKSNEVKWVKIKKIRNALVFVLWLWGVWIVFALGVVDAFWRSDQEQVRLDKQYGDMRARITSTINNLWAIPDYSAELSGVIFERRTKDVPFIDRDLYDTSDYYQLNGKEKLWEYDVFIAIPFKIPENIVVWVWPLRAELENPTKEQVESKIQELYNQLEAEKEENTTIIETRKATILSIINNLMEWNSQDLHDDRIFVINWPNGETAHLRFAPEKLLGDLEDDGKWLDDDEKFRFNLTELVSEEKTAISTSTNASYIEISLKEPHEVKIRIGKSSSTSIFIETFYIDDLNRYIRALEETIFWKEDLLAEERQAIEKDLEEQANLGKQPIQDIIRRLTWDTQYNIDTPTSITLDVWDNTISFSMLPNKWNGWIVDNNAWLKNEWQYFLYADSVKVNGKARDWLRLYIKINIKSPHNIEYFIDYWTFNDWSWGGYSSENLEALFAKLQEYLELTVFKQ